MYLDAVSNNTINETYSGGSANAFVRSRKIEVFEQWKRWHPSQISHHSKICCEIAREWLTATDYSELNGNAIYTGPRWLQQKFKWGASTFPLYWCEAVRKKTLDCGALAVLAHEVFTARGVKTYRIQLVQKFSNASTNQWLNSWNNNDEPLAWVNDDLIYHEGCAIVTADNQIKVWDASAGWWIDSKPSDGYGAVLAIRFSGSNLRANKNIIWGEHQIVADEWTAIS
jgi:hypothetical protein